MAVPLCRHFGPCGGCDWQDLAYPEQLERKRATVAELLHATLGPRTPAIEPVVGMNADATGWPWRFRHKASFVFGESVDRKGPVIGHYAARSRVVVPIVECPVHASRANQLAFALHDHFLRAHVTAAGPALRGVLRHLIVRTTANDREAVAMLVVTRNDKGLRRPIREFLGTEDAPDGFYLNIHDRPGPYMVGRETIRLSGRSHVKETVGGVGFLLSPTAFFQTNVEAAETLLRLVVDALTEEPLRVLDLYSGSGLFSLPLVARGHQVTSIEESGQAIRDAEANVRLNRLPPASIRLIAARVEDALRGLGRDPYDAVILDPPRQGCPPHVITEIFRRRQPARAVYVSCNPEALAGEMPAILDAGYQADRVQPVDMFPHTTHIETVVTFSRSSSPGTRGSRRAPRDSPTRRPPRR